MKIRKGIVNHVDGNNTKMQTMQIEGLHGELADKVERYQEYGFSSFPVAVNNNDGTASEVLIAELGSNDMAVVIAADDRRYRPIHGFAGDSIIYTKHDTPAATHNNATHRIALTDDGGADYRTILKVHEISVVLKSDNTITISHPNGSMTIAPDGAITLSGTTLTINADVSINGTLVNNGVNISSTHKHPDAQGGTTGTPQ